MTNSMKTPLILLAFTLLFTACAETIDNTGTCSDGILNQGEQQTDCGGPCPARCESCADGIMNQGETAVDCGGPCDPCYPRMSATIDSTEWWATSRNAFLLSPTEIRIYGTDGTHNLTLSYKGTFAPGTVVTGPLFTGELRNASGATFTSGAGGSITFTTFDTLSKTVSGIYKFTATDPASGTVHDLQHGVFTVIGY
jgi:hypothetical protein